MVPVPVKTELHLMLFCPSFTSLTHKPTKKDNFKTVKFTSPVETEKALLAN